MNFLESVSNFFSPPVEETAVTSDYSQYFTKDLFSEIVDKNNSIMMYFTKQDGWVGANKIFFEKFALKDIEEFRTKYESVRELFLNESEEIFTEDDKSWLDYIRKHKKEGYHLTLSSSDDVILSINAKCHLFSQSREFYILELEDITELYHARMKTQEVEKLKTKFLSNIGHEFRTPMNGILGFIELISYTDLDKKQKEYIQMIGRSSKNLMSNIESLLDLSQMQGGRLKLENSYFELLPEMEKLAYTSFVQAKDKGIRVLSFIDPKLPLELHGDLRKIKQVMNSLIQNAIKFTSSGGRIIIEVKLLKRNSDGKCSIGFSVKDNGKGIANEQISLITEPFHAGNQADERLGVGLSLSHGLVSLMGSELRIQSEEGHGSYFYFVLDFDSSKGQSYKMMPKQRAKVLLLDKDKVDDANFLTIYLRSFALEVSKSNILDEHVYDSVDTLYIVADQNDRHWMTELNRYNKSVPVVVLIDEDEKLKSELTHIVDAVVLKPIMPSQISKHLISLQSDLSTINAPDKYKIKSRIRALVVEDNLINQKLIQILLEEYKIFVSTASDGVKAVEMSKQNKFDIVFMDIDMPEKDGISATKEIKDVLNPNGKTPIVALTAMAMEGDREMLLEAGLDDYLSKPLTREKLERILEKYLKVKV